MFDAAGNTCPALDADAARAMVAAGTARDGMVAKLGACLDALAGGVAEVRIVDGRAGDFAQRAGHDDHHQLTRAAVHKMLTMTRRPSDPIALDAQHVLQVYRRAPVVFESGKGCALFTRDRASAISI